MNASELMVGDFVKIKTDDDTFIKVQIRTLEFDIMWANIDDDETCDAISYDDIEPIPLTPEILEKNGFVYKEREETCATEEYHIWSLVNTSFFLDDDSWWRKEKDDILRLKFGISKIKFLHELQHALKLCGIEKEIEL